MVSDVKKTSPFTLIFTVFALAIGCLAIWKAADAFLLGFAAILFAILINFVSSWITEKVNLSYRVVVLGVLFLFLLILFSVFWFSSSLINEQMNALITQIVEAYQQLRDKMVTINWGGLTKEKLTSEFITGGEKLLLQATAIFTFTIGTISGLIVFFLVAIYLAFSPEGYVRGFTWVFPSSYRNKVLHILRALRSALQWWMIGKFVSMFAIGILTYIGLKILKAPLPFILAFIAALLTFIPYIGAIIASVPAILIALANSPLLALYVTLLYCVIHAIDGYLISPYVDQKTVSLPPALAIISQLLFAIWFGFLGIILAAPLVVVALVLIKEWNRTHKYS